MPRSLQIVERMPLPDGGAVATDQSGLLDRPVLDDGTDSLNDRDEGALPSKYDGHLIGSFPSSAGQKRSGRNPSHYGRWAVPLSADNQCQLAIKATEFIIRKAVGSFP